LTRRKVKTLSNEEIAENFHKLWENQRDLCDTTHDLENLDDTVEKTVDVINKLIDSVNHLSQRLDAVGIPETPQISDPEDWEYLPHKYPPKY
jgi:hypothetical protein